jgi:class 3 adenylate cyclase
MHAGIPAFGPAYVKAQTCNRLSKDLGSTVLFCDLVDSTGIASKLDATDLDA